MPKEKSHENQRLRIQVILTMLEKIMRTMNSVLLTTIMLLLFKLLRCPNTLASCHMFLN